MSLANSVSHASVPAVREYPVHCHVATYDPARPEDRAKFIAVKDLKLVDGQYVEVARTETAIYEASYGTLNFPKGTMNEWVSLLVTDLGGKEFVRAQNSWLRQNKHFSTTVQSEMIEPGLHVDFTCTVPHKPVKVP